MFCCKITRSGSNDGNVSVWDGQNGFALVTRLEGHIGRVTAVDVHQQHNIFISIHSNVYIKCMFL